MADNKDLQSNLPQATEDSQDASSSDSDEEVSRLQTMFLEDFDSFSEPVTGTGFIYHDKMAQHKCEWDQGYPENPQRLIQPLNRCTQLGLVQRCQRLAIRYATEDEIIWKHTRDHVELAQSTAEMGLKDLMALCEKYDAWYANKITYEASLIAAGSTISMVEHIIQDKISNGFAMVRPPGHHAMEEEFNGYCTFNNVALAAQFALNSGIEKVLIVDWDVHHGQGTQRMFYDDPRVLYFSIHRYEHGKFWPQLRESDYDYIGKGNGQGFNINIPLNKTGMTDSDYMAAFNMVLLPVAYEFQPQLILISSGYDAAVGCPELYLLSAFLTSLPDSPEICPGFMQPGEMLVSPAMYAQMTHQLMALATGRVCVVLEGGYCIQSLAEGCALTLRSLLHDPCPQLPAFTEPSDSMMTTILNVIKILRKFWKCFRHFETLDGAQECPYKDVNEMPPVSDVTFSTPENRPEKFEIINCYPVQEEKTRLYFADLISKLIAETSLSVAEHRCCYVFDSEMRSHKNLHDKSHPERPDRISKIYNSMAEWKLLQKCLTVASRLARKSELLWIHGEDYINNFLQSQTKADDELKHFPSQHQYTSIFLHQKTVHCALLSCGSLLNVVEAVLRGKAQSGVAIVRPPGHHAESNTAMGFCFINNVAVAAKFAQVHFGLKRILIVDWDVHHGNATQHQFYNDPSVLYISLHRYDSGNFFPGSSDADLDSVGFGPGEGYNVNIPWSHARMGDAEYMTAFTQIIMPIAYQFAPELVLVSAGYDCAVGDPLGGYGVTPACFGHMTHMLMGLANGRVVLSLEGGYNLNSLSHSMATCTATLLGYPCPMLGPLAPNERAVRTIREVLEVQKKYWTSLKGYVPIPSVRKGDNDSWVIEQVHSNRQMRTRRSGGSRSAQDQTIRPASAGHVAKPKRGVGVSSSDSSVTTTPYTATTESTKTTTTYETEATTESTSTETSTQPTKDGTTASTEQSTNDASATGDSTSVSAPNRNLSNISDGIAVASSENKPEISLSLIPETHPTNHSGSVDPELARQNVAPFLEQGDASSQSTVQANTSTKAPELASGLAPELAPGLASGLAPGLAPELAPGLAPELASGLAPELAPGLAPELASGLAPELAPGLAPELASGLAPELASELQNLTLADNKTSPPIHEQPSGGTATSDSREVVHQEPGSQACSDVDDGKSNEPEVSQKSPPHSTPTPVTADVDPTSPPTKPPPSTAERATPSDETLNLQHAVDGHEVSGPPAGSGDGAGARPKTKDAPQYVFRSQVYGDEPDPEPLSIFAGNPLMASQEDVLIEKERRRRKNATSPKSDTAETSNSVRSVGMADDASGGSEAVGASHEDKAGVANVVPSCAESPGSSGGNGEEGELVGACGGSSNPATVRELIMMQGFQEMHAVQPLPWCPHLTEVNPLPRSGFSPKDPCRTCGDLSENWVCLTCYAVECSRFVNEHMLMHRVETGHNMALSYADLSVWCYTCDQYVDNEVLAPIITVARGIKFGESFI